MPGALQHPVDGNELQHGVPMRYVNVAMQLLPTSMRGIFSALGADNLLVAPLSGAWSRILL